MIIRELSCADSAKVATLHTEAFKSFFLTRLGKRFLNKFYQAIFSHSNGIALGLFDNEELYAFAVGSTKKSGFYSSIINRHFFTLIWSCLPVLILNPQNIFRIFKSLNTNETVDKEIMENSSLLSICVNPKYSKSGFGQKILLAFEEKAFFKNHLISLTTDAIGNDHVNSFYKKNGYLLYKEFTQGSRIMNLYIKKNNAR
jgi:ribosomal protein S18 acetylase RimI-like enzyme